MFTTIINDCTDDNARGRIESRVTSLISTSISFIGVMSDIEASMQLVDVLDATEGRPGLILVNVAPRGGHSREWENGTPFGYFWYHDTLIIASVEGFTLSAVKALGLMTELSLLDTRTAAEAMRAAGFITEGAAKRIPTSQFRSFDFIPRAGAYLLDGNVLPSEPYDLGNIADLPKAIWHIDNFGNCKTTLTKFDIKPGETITRFGDLPFHTQLRDVPDATAALIEGSSGSEDTRFVELVIQQGNFARVYNAHIGDDVFSDKSYFRKATN
jgi:S-adenosyl-l-methionine hydroxide adenosyltransferase